MQLVPGQTYTFQVNSNQLFNFTGEDTVKEHVAWFMEGTGTVHSVERPMLTRDYEVRLEVSSVTDSETVSGILRTAFVQAGYSNAEVVSVEDGTQTTNILKEAMKNTKDALKPLGNLGDWSLKLVWGIVVAILLGMLFWLLLRRSSNG